MGEALQRRIKQSRFANTAQEAVLNLLVAADYVRRRLDQVCAAHGITHRQFNVLRILKGVHPGGHPRCELMTRMIEQAPDATRMVDRLEAQGLVERTRSKDDRRLSLTRITDQGLDLLEAMRPSFEAHLKEIRRKLTPADARELSRICELLYDEKTN